MDIQDNAKSIIEFLSLDYKEIPSVLEMAERTVPKYKGSVQPYQAAFLYWLTSKYVPTYGSILEIGTGLGYTAYVMALAKPSAIISTLNSNAEEVKLAQKTLQKFDYVGVVQTTSRSYFNFESSMKSDMKYDLIFIDGDHKDIAFDCNWYNCLTDNGVIVFHDYSPLGSWSACPPVYNHLNLKRLEWGEPTHLVRDLGNVGMIAWENGTTNKPQKKTAESLTLNLNPL